MSPAHPRPPGRRPARRLSRPLAPVPRGALCALALAVVLVGPARAAAELFAGEVTPENARARLVGGPDGVGGIGDWALGNGTLCAVVSRPDRATDVSVTGGFLLDLGHCGAGDDQLGSLVPMVNVSRENVPVVEHVAASVDPQEARVATRARWKGLEVRSEYVLDLASPERLRLETRIARVASGGRLSVVGLISIHPNASLRAFTFDSQHPELAVGFEHPAAPGENLRSMLGGLGRSDVQVLVGGADGGPGIAYGIRLAEAWREAGDGSRRALPAVALNGAPFTLLGVFPRPFWFGGGVRVGLLQLLQSLFMNVSEGETVQLVHHVEVGDRADVASVTDRWWAAGPEVAGRLDDPAGRVHVRRAGRPVTEARPDAEGRFALRVPEPGDYELRVVAPGARDVRLPVEVPASGARLGRVALAGAGRVLLPRGHAMRLVFQGLAGTPDPRIGDDLLGLRFGDFEPVNSLLGNDVSLAGTPGDPSSVTLAPGRYRVTATRGLEWSVEETEIFVQAGEPTPLAIGLPQRAFATPGWVLADLHVHAAGSFDSTFPYAERIRSFVAQGGEVLVSTEHDHVVDYRPELARMGLASVLRVIPGLEVTGITRTPAVPHTAGHANVLPLAPEPFAHRGGALRSQGVRLREVAAELRSRGGRRLLQVNHPRMSDGERDDEALFSHLAVAGRGFDPARPLADEPNRVLIERDPGTGLRDLDFDAIELLNGATLATNAYYRRVRADWLSLLLQGERRTATANSDSHKRRQLVAIPTNYVRVADDRPARLDEAAFVSALLEGAVSGTTGPFLDVTLAGVGPGGTYAGASADLSVRVEAADWVPVAELRVYVDGALHTRQPVAAGERTSVPLAFARDAFVTVEVEGSASGDAARRYRAVAPEFIPFAFSNPIFVDADGDGVYTAPGLAGPLPPTVTDPVGG